MDNLLDLKKKYFTVYGIMVIMVVLCVSGYHHNYVLKIRNSRGTTWKLYV